MAKLYPFRALRPLPDAAPAIAAVPYDVVDVEEARVLAKGNPLSFLRVSRAEIDLAAGTDPYSDAVYDCAARNFESLRDGAFVLEEQPSLYFYRLQTGAHSQTGLAGSFSIDEYDRGIIKRHERTRRDKEDDRTRHMIAIGAQTGPVFLTYRALREIDALASSSISATPLFDFEAADGVRHTIWRVGGAERDALAAAFACVPALYIADGHHRAASAARARDEMRSQSRAGASLGDGADYSTMLAVAFPHDQVRIISYNRVVKDLGGLTPEGFNLAARERFEIERGPAVPERRGDIAMYCGGSWYTLRQRAGSLRAAGSDSRAASLDVSVLQDQLLSPILKIADVRTDKRIDFVSGARGTSALERLVDLGRAAVAFSLYPVSVSDLMMVSDAGEIMPPKSTWFEPKLRDGLLVHLI